MIIVQITMFLIFFTFISEYLKLTEKNFNESIQSAKEKPVVAMLWHSFCPHSKAFLPIWAKIVENMQNNNDIILGDLECQNNPTLCKNMIGEVYPQVMWIEPKYGIVEKFDGKKEYEEVMEFIKDMKYFPCSVNLTKEEITRREKLATEYEPFFKFIVPDTKIEILDLVKRVFIDSEVKKSQLYCEIGVRSTPKLITYGTGTRNDDDIYSNEYNGEYLHKDLVEYVESANLGQIIDFNNRTNIILQRTKRIYIIMSIDEKKVPQMKEIVKSFGHHHFRFAFESFNKETSIAMKLFRFKASQVPFVAAVDPHLSKYTVYKGKIKTAELQKWFESIQKISSWKTFNKDLSISQEDKKLYLLWLAILIVPIVACVVFMLARKNKYVKVPKVLASARI